MLALLAAGLVFGMRVAAAPIRAPLPVPATNNNPVDPHALAQTIADAYARRIRPDALVP